MKNLNPDLPLLDFEKSMESAYQRARKILKQKFSPSREKAKEQVRKQIVDESRKLYKKLSHWEKTLVARHPHRPYALDYIDRIFCHFHELHGDRRFGDDMSTVCGLAELEGESVVVVGQQKGRNMDENVRRNFGMPRPEGYRKALRMFHLAEKFQKPVITFIDTPGAYPGIESEERSQAQAIAENLKVMAGLTVPVVSAIIGEGGSGGALGIGVANGMLMMEHAIYSVISPESCASILWKDVSQKEKAATALKNDAKTALKFHVVDEIVPEGPGGAHRDWDLAAANLGKAIKKHLEILKSMKPIQLKQHRIEKFSRLGEFKIL